MFKQKYENDWADAKARKRRGAAPRPPLRTPAEMAEILGVTMPHLRSAYGVDADAPPPVFRKWGNIPAKYNPVEMRKWWAARSTK